MIRLSQRGFCMCGALLFPWKGVLSIPRGCHNRTGCVTIDVGQLPTTEVLSFILLSFLHPFVLTILFSVSFITCPKIKVSKYTPHAHESMLTFRLSLDTWIRSPRLGSGPILLSSTVTFSPCLCSLNAKRKGTQMKTTCLRLSRNSFHVCFFSRNYHVFYYLLAGASEEERKAFHLKKPEEYHYLSQVGQKRDNNQRSHLDLASLFLKLVPHALINWLRLCRQEI